MSFLNCSYFIWYPNRMTCICICLLNQPLQNLKKSATCSFIFVEPCDSIYYQHEQYFRTKRKIFEFLSPELSVWDFSHEIRVFWFFSSESKFKVFLFWFDLLGFSHQIRAFVGFTFLCFSSISSILIQIQTSVQAIQGLKTWWDFYP